MRKAFLFSLFLLAAATAPAQTLSNSTLFKVIDGNDFFTTTLSDIVTFVNAGSGTVTSVGLALPSEFTISGSPVTTSGTLTGTWANQTTNKVFASPNGSTGTPTFRALAAADIPTLPAAKVTGEDVTAGSSKVSVTGGTGASLADVAIDVVESNLTLNNIGGTLGNSKGGTGLTSPGGNGTVLGSDGTNFLALSPTVTLNAATTGFSRNGSNLELNLPNADGSNRGTVSPTTQTFGGAKTFLALITGSAGITGTSASSAAAVYANGVGGSKWTKVTTSTTLDETHNTVEVGTLSAGITLTLPACNATRNGWEYHFVKSGNDAFGTTVDPNGSEQFMDAASTKVIYGRGTALDCKCTHDGSTGVWIYASK